MRTRRKVEPGAFWKGLAKKVTLTGDTGWQTISTSSFGKLLSDNDDSALLKAFSLSEIVFACVREKATAVNDAPLEVVRDTEDGVEVVDHEALSLFYDNKYYSYADLLNLMVSRLELTGASRCLMNLYRNRDGVGEIIPLPSNIVKANSNAVQIVGYEITRDGDSPLVVDPEEILDIRYVDPASFMGYISPLSAAYRQYRTDEQREILTNELLENRQVPGLMLEQQAGQALTRDQVTVLRDTLTERVGGGKRGKSLVIPFGLKVAPGIDVKDIDFSALASLTESRICMAFQVPPILIGAKVGLDKATYANYKEARKSFYRESMKAIWNILAEGFTRNIFRKHGEEELYFRFDTSNVSEMQEDEGAKANRVVVLFNAGVIDRNEARQEVGYDPIEEEVPVDETDPEEPADEQDDNKDALAGKARMAIGRYPQERALETILIKEFKKQNAEIVSYIKNNAPIDYDKIFDNMGNSIKPILTEIYQENAKKTLRKLLERAKKSNDFSAKAENITNSFDVINPLLAQAIENQTIKLSKSTIAYTKQSVEEASNNVRKAISEGIISGENTVKSLTDAVSKKLGSIEEWRARRIAVTESSRAVHDSDIISAYQSGVVKSMIPIISIDACELCQAYSKDGEPTGLPLFPETPIEKALDQVGEYGNRTLPPFHPNCRCTAGYIFVDGPQVDLPGTQRSDGIKPREPAQELPIQMAIDISLSARQVDKLVAIDSVQEKLPPIDSSEKVPLPPTGKLRQEYIETRNSLKKMETDFNPWAGTLSREEKATIAEYTRTDYSGINRVLRGDVSGRTQKQIQDITEASNKLSQIISKAPKIESNFTVYRGITHAEKLLSDISVGDVFIEKGFMSTSLEKKSALNFMKGENTALIKIKTNGKASGILIDSIYKDVKDYSSEFELLIQRGTRLRLTAIEKELGRQVYVMEIL